jgi:hypothetical protein
MCFSFLFLGVAAFLRKSTKRLKSKFMHCFCYCNMCLHMYITWAWDLTPPLRYGFVFLNFKQCGWVLDRFGTNIHTCSWWLSFGAPLLSTLGAHLTGSQVLLTTSKPWLVGQNWIFLYSLQQASQGLRQAEFLLFMRHFFLWNVSKTVMEVDKGHNSVFFNCGGILWDQYWTAYIEIKKDKY